MSPARVRSWGGGPSRAAQDNEQPAHRSVTVGADRVGHKNATETLHTYSHLWPSSDDKTRQVLDKAFAAVDVLHAEHALR